VEGVFPSLGREKGIEPEKKCNSPEGIMPFLFIWTRRGEITGRATAHERE